MTGVKKLLVAALMGAGVFVSGAEASGLNEPFSTNPTLSATEAPGVWYTDRFAPSGFVRAFFDGDNRLKESIDASACSSCRGGGFSSSFYDTQGRKFDLPAGTTVMSIQMYVPSTWATSGKRMAGFWGTAFNNSSTVTNFPIIEFTDSPDGSGGPRFRGWDESGNSGAGAWIDMGLPTGFVYDAWYTLNIQLTGGMLKYTVGDLTLSVAADADAPGTAYIGNTILEGHNNAAGVTYDIYWDNLTTASTAALALHPVTACANSGTVTVNVDMSGATDAVVGGQFFMHYDTSRLQFVSVAPGSAPFTIPVYTSLDTVNGLIDFAVGVPGGGPGTTADSTMAVLTFNWIGADSCGTGDSLVEFRAHNPATRLTNSTGDPIYPTETPTPSITVDSTAPVITCPGNIVTNADAGLCTYSLLGPEWRTYGVASLHDSVVELLSDNSQVTAWSGVVYEPASPFLFSALTTLSTDYAMVQGCFGGGAPRFSVGIDTNGDGQSDGEAHVYIGSTPNFIDCPTIGQWSNTGNLVNSPDARWETQAFGGPFYGTHAQALALLGSYSVVYVTLDVDGGWSQSGGIQDMLADNMTVNTTVQTFGGVPGATSADNCTATPAISVSRSDGLSLGARFPVGTTTVTWTATDSCGNSSSCPQLVTVNAFNTLTATVQLSPTVSSGPFNRCISFGLPTGGCSTFVDQVMSFNGGTATATFDIPCGSYSCLTARDQRHTLRTTATTGDGDFYISGSQYVADFTGAAHWLVGGNLNDDSVIDILDFGAFVGQYGANYGTANTTCSTPFPHADISGDGIVFTQDFTFIQINFLKVSDPDCCGGLRPGGLPSIPVAKLISMGHAEMAVADLNNDGWVDQADMALFASNGASHCGSSDFNCDGDIGTDTDIESFFSCLAGNCPSAPCTGSADFNGDGDLGTDADIESFFRVLAGGHC